MCCKHRVASGCAAIWKLCVGVRVCVVCAVKRHPAGGGHDPRTGGASAWGDGRTRSIDSGRAVEGSERTATGAVKGQWKGSERGSDRAVTGQRKGQCQGLVTRQ